MKFGACFLLRFNKKLRLDFLLFIFYEIKICHMRRLNIYKALNNSHVKLYVARLLRIQTILP